MKLSTKEVEKSVIPKKEIILKHALKNAADYRGKANPKVVLGAVLKESPELKKDVPAVMKEIEKAITDIEKLTIEEQQQKLQQLAPSLASEEKKKAPEGPLKPLPNAQKGKVVVRIAPSPSGALHIGHAYGAALNYEYARMYDGKFLLRLEDTNPENIYPAAYQLIEDDVRWLTDNNLAQIIVQSSHLGTYYDHAEQLVQKRKAYVCLCDADQWRELKNKATACPCRNLSVEENQQRYAKMFNEYAEGEAVLRLKTDITHKNPAMRDFPIMRIVEHIHSKIGKEQRVWPLMIFAVAIDDHESGITHVLNGKDHTDNAAKERQIMEYLGWKAPEYKHWGRINFEGFALSSSETRIAIEQGEFSGWDDIRLPFLPALRRRGYQPGAFRKFALEIGLSLNDKTVSREEFWKMINAFNREIIEKPANRYFFIDHPVEITVESAPEQAVTLDLHPDFPERGKRNFKAGKKLWISEQDYQRLSDGYLHRLMDYCNFRVSDTGFHHMPGSYEDYKKAEHKGHIIHWLPATQVVPVEVMMDYGAAVKGYGEEALLKLAEGTIIQLERRYFVRLDKKEKGKVVFWYLHR